ncbi:MAG: hypothetical protein PWP24_1077 [Clostridiales bacterium]|nr:hypothetical protein [Clostridiales bacterium]
MQLKYIPALSMLTAGAVICIVSIANKMDKLLSLEILLGVLIAFYIIGLIAKAIITKVIESGGIKEDSQAEDEQTQEDEDGQEATEEPEDSNEGK